MIVGKIVPDIGDVRTNQVGVVQQPFGRMRDSIFQSRGFGQDRREPVQSGLRMSAGSATVEVRYPMPSVYADQPRLSRDGA